MQNKTFLVISSIFLFSFSIFASSNAENLAIQATSENKAEAQKAIDNLRLMKQVGLETLLRTYSTQIEAYKKTGIKDANWQRIANAIDTVAMQKDAYASGLFWHTDMSKALAESKEMRKPILTLRLLGNLNEEYSCANSRFFRSILYSNEKISNYLKENYILHWKSVRPAPKITIDFGDGRKLVRTITGNSIHYILDERGRILDALPGLYNPQTFLEYLVNVNRAKRTKRKPKQFWSDVYRNQNRNRLLAKWQSDLNKLGVDTSSTSKLDIRLPATPARTSTGSNNSSEPKNENGKNPSALRAAPLAVTKSAVEMPTVRSITYDSEALKKSTTFEEWKKLSELFGKAKIDENSKNFILHKADSKEAMSNKEFASLISNLEKYVSIDTVQNEYIFHTKIYQWLNEGLYLDVETFNDRVYSELFLTPKSDKWLGLYSPDIYSAIENNGVVK